MTVTVNGTVNGTANVNVNVRIGLTPSGTHLLAPASLRLLKSYLAAGRAEKNSEWMRSSATMPSRKELPGQTANATRAMGPYPEGTGEQLPSVQATYRLIDPRRMGNGPVPRERLFHQHTRVLIHVYNVRYPLGQ